jgi:hypothetical protein
LNTGSERAEDRSGGNAKAISPARQSGNYVTRVVGLRCRIGHRPKWKPILLLTCMSIFEMFTMAALHVTNRCIVLLHSPSNILCAAFLLLACPQIRRTRLRAKSTFPRIERQYCVLTKEYPWVSSPQLENGASHCRPRLSRRGVEFYFDSDGESFISFPGLLPLYISPYSSANCGISADITPLARSSFVL